MKQCPKCNKEHSKPGTYCCRSCANGKHFTDESKAKKSASNKLYYKTVDPLVTRARIDKSMATNAVNRKEKIISGTFDNLSVTLKREQILHEQNQLCNICKCEQLWNNMKLKFQLDHISGDRKDESRTNLQMICPNCHSQTDTYGGKNGTKITNKQIEEAITQYSNNNQLCIAIGLNPSAYAYDRINKIRNK